MTARVARFDIETARAVAAAYSSQIVARVDGLAAVCLGGSVATTAHTLDDVSDIDLFCYLTREQAPPVDELIEAIAPISQLSQVRRRAQLTEFRCELEGIDTNVKLFPLAFVVSTLQQEPTLDEIYLEEMFAYSIFRVLYCDDNTMSNLLEDARAPWRLHRLVERGFEVFGKHIATAVRQSIYRTSEAMSATLNLTTAITTLVSLAYLLDDRFPVSFKWRGSPSYLRALHRGEELSGLLEEWRASTNPLDIPLTFELVARMESVVSDDFHRGPWRNYRDDPWWWVGYIPAADQLSKREDSGDVYAHGD